MQEQLSPIERVKHWYRGLPDKKRYFEFVTALLTIPVLLTVIATNFFSLQRQRQPQESQSSPSAQTIEVVIPTSLPGSSPSAAPAPSCKPGVGPIAIISPQEGEVIAHDPVNIDIERQSSEYCAVVWAYRINGGAWSDYTDKSISLYGLPPGEKQLQVRIRSVVASEEVLLSRTFTVAGSTPTPTATDSAETQ